METESKTETARGIRALRTQTETVIINRTGTTTPARDSTPGSVQQYAPRTQYRPRYYNPYHQGYAPQHQKNQHQQSNPSGKNSNKKEKKEEKKEKKDRATLPTGKLMFIGSIKAWKLDTADALAFWKAELLKNNLWNLGNKPLLMLVEDRSHDLEQFKTVLEAIKAKNPVIYVILTDHQTTDAKSSSFRK